MINRAYYFYIRKEGSGKWATRLVTYRSFFEAPQKVYSSAHEDACKLWGCEPNQVIIKSFVRI